MRRVRRRGNWQPIRYRLCPSPADLVPQRDSALTEGAEFHATSAFRRPSTLRWHDPGFDRCRRGGAGDRHACETGFAKLVQRLIYRLIVATGRVNIQCIRSRRYFFFRRTGAVGRAKSIHTFIELPLRALAAVVDTAFEDLMPLIEAVYHACEAEPDLC